MSTLLGKLARGNAGSSFVSIGADLHTDQLDFSFESMMLQSNLDEYSRVSSALDAVDQLSKSFFAAESSRTPEQVELYSLSVESVFSAAGIPFPVSTLVASFESTADYSTEAENKAAGMLRRAGAWLLEQLKKIGEGIMALLDKFKNSAAAGKARAEKLKERVMNLKKKPTSDVSTESASGGQVQVANVHLIGAGGSSTVGMLKDTEANTRKAGMETLEILRKTMDIFKAFKPGEHDSAEGSEQVIKNLVSSLGLKEGSGGWGRELPIGPGNTVLVELTKGQNNRISARVSNKQAEKKSGTLPGMTADECVRCLDTLISSYASVDSMKGPMDNAARIFRSMSERMNTAFKEQMQKITAGADREAAKTASSAAQTYAMFGTILSQFGRLPRENVGSYMQTQWAVEKYMDSCVDLLEGKKAA